MFFYEYEYENGYNWKRVYYNVPDAEEFKDSLQRISTICREELKNMYLDQSIPQSNWIRSEETNWRLKLKFFLRVWR